MKIHPYTITHSKDYLIVITYVRDVFKLPTIVFLFLGLYVRNSWHDICISFLSVLLSFFLGGGEFI